MSEPIPSLSYQFAELFGIHGLLNRMQSSQKIFMREKLEKMLAGRMYVDYKREHPECVGRYTSCCNCGGSRIWAKKLIPALDGSVSEHCCRDCGEQLFFSITGSMLKEILEGDNTHQSMREIQNVQPVLENEGNLPTKSENPPLRLLLESEIIHRPTSTLQTLSLHPPKR